MNIVSALQEWYESSIRFRILSTIGLIVTVLMVLISFAILYQWRSLIIDELENNARSIAKSFSIPVIDALIQAEQQEITGADHLESHIHNFLENVPSIKYISIQDNRNLIIGHSDLTMYNQPLTSERLLHVIETRETLTSIFEDPEYGWVLEVLQPLQIGEKRWGTAILGFDASATRKKAGTSFFQLLFLTVVALSVTLGLIYFFIQRILSSLRSLVHEV
ncbi:hypothetical protein QLX67_13370, partial [Balneolaceae bacterium ANBcel3]|nr:hypothetical protein [Balneolaceae bacterium ANBcel3]